MTAAARSVDAATNRYSEIMDQVRGLIPMELYLDLDTAVMDYAEARRMEVLNNLVIGIYGSGDFPTIEHAVFTRAAVEVQIDECDHRNTARNAAYYRAEGKPEMGDRCEKLARASLEEDLGHLEESRRLVSEARP